MKNMTLFLSVLLFSVFTYAANNLPKGLVYYQDINAVQKKESVDKFNRIFDESKHHALSLKGEAAPIQSLDWASAAYFNKKINGLIILKTGIETSTEIKENFIYVAEQDFIVHIKESQAGKYSVLYFTGYSKNEVQNFVNEKLKNVTFLKNNRSLIAQYFLMNRAEASEASTICNEPSVMPIERLQGVGAGGGLLNRVAGCMDGLTSGLWNVTGGAAIESVKGVYKAVTHPIETFRNVKTGLANLQHFVVNFSSEMNKLGNAFTDLPIEIKTKVICEAVTTLGAGFAVGIITGGAASGLVAKSIHSIVSKVQKTFPNNQQLLKLASQTKAISPTAESTRYNLGFGSYMNAVKYSKGELKKLYKDMNKARSIKEHTLLHAELNGVYSRLDVLNEDMPLHAIASTARVGAAAGATCLTVGSLKEAFKSRLDDISKAIDKKYPNVPTEFRETQDTPKNN